MSKPNIRHVCRRLEKEYGNPAHGNKLNPLDELIYIILSTRTRDPSFQETYKRLKRAFPSWRQVTAEKFDELYAILARGGLGKLKSEQILQILDAIQQRFGYPTLAPLKQLSDQEIECFLTSLPGVAKKIAKCVMMYSLHREVLPVDVHVHRICHRLGLRTKRRPDTSQDMIEASVPPSLRYGFHVNAVAHGRAICLPNTPRCEQCCINRFCAFSRKRKQQVTKRKTHRA